MNIETTPIIAVFENPDIRFNYCYWGRGGLPLVFFTGFGEKTYSYKNLLPALPSNVSLLAIETPITFFRKDHSIMEKALTDLLFYLGLKESIYLGGFSFGNWIATSIIQSKVLTIRAWILVSPPTPFNYRAFKVLNNSKYLNTFVKKAIGSTYLKNLLLWCGHFFIESGAKKALIIRLIKGNKTKDLLHKYLTSSTPKGALSAKFKHAKSFNIPTLLLASLNDPITKSNKTIEQASMYLDNAQVFYTKNSGHHVSDKEFLKELDSFLRRICI